MQEIGDLGQKSTDLEAVTWKITNVSSLLFAVDYGVQSPRFSFCGAVWIIKIYFNGQKKFNSKGYIDVAIERLHSEVEVHSTACKIYFKNVFDKEFKPIRKNFTFDTNNVTMDMVKIMENFLRSFDKWEIVPNDTLTLVFEIANSKSLVNKQASDLDKSEDPVKQGVGTIYKNSYKMDYIKWTIPNASSLPSPADYQVQSPQFSFVSSSWALKIYPYFRLESADKHYFYITLVRLQSQISEHFVSGTFVFEDSVKKTSTEVSRSHIFDSNNLQGDAICFTLQKEQFIAPHDTLSLLCIFRTKKIDERSLGSQMKLDESVKGYNLKSGFTFDLCKYKVIQDLKELFLKQEDCDVIIKVKGREFPAHRAILKARCPVFDSAFRNDMKERKTNVIDVEDCDPNTFSDFLCFVYCGDIENLSVEHVFDLFITADKYAVMDLRSKCLNFIKENLTVETFCDSIALALKYSEAELVKFSTDFFAKNLQKIIVTVKWQSYITENPITANELMIKALVPNDN